MTLRYSAALVAALLPLAPNMSHAALSAYNQNFETMVMADPAALQNDGWLVFGNVFTPADVYMYGYGPFPAPNPGPGFSALVSGEGGAEQGAQQLSVYSDYNNTDHGNLNLVESNVFREQTVDASDAGTTWAFSFDAKRGNLEGATTAVAFIKTLDPANGWAMTNFITADMTAIPQTWGRYSISIVIDPSLAGQILQTGFANTATNYQGSGVFYDNLSWLESGTLDVAGMPRSSSIEMSAAAPNPFTQSTLVEYSLARRATAEVAVYDVVGRRVATLFDGQAEPGAHVATWDGRFADGRLAPNGVYHCVLRTDEGQRARRVVLSR